MTYFIRISLLVAIYCFTTLLGYGQQDPITTKPEPVGGIQQLVLVYYKIDFTKQQRQALQNRDIECIYAIDKEGKATLEKINGVPEPDLLDSLQQASRHLPLFTPRQVDGVKESALYFLTFQFPQYRPVPGSLSYQDVVRYRETKYEDFASIHRSGQRLDLLFGAFGNAYSGQAGKYLGPGGGMKIDMMYSGKKGIGGGLLMSFSGNKLKQAYPLEDPRKQNAAPPTLLFGLGLNKTIYQKERKEFNAQLELNYAVQNVAPAREKGGTDYIQFAGFSPGLVGNYLIQLGKNKTYFYYGSPAIVTKYLNFHGAIRPVFYNRPEARGIMLEAGVSYRLGYHFVDEFKLKQELKD